MKRFLRCLAVVLVLVTVLGTVASAQEVSTRASSYFGSWNSYCYKVASNKFQIWFDVVSAGGMLELGAEYIEVQRSANGVDWTTVKTYDRDDYSNMIKTNTSCVCDYVSYTCTRGYYYRAVVLFYAKNANGSGGMWDYTSRIYMG